MARTKRKLGLTIILGVMGSVNFGVVYFLASNQLWFATHHEDSIQDKWSGCQRWEDTTANNAQIFRCVVSFVGYLLLQAALWITINVYKRKRKNTPSNPKSHRAQGQTGTGRSGASGTEDKVSFVMHSTSDE